MRFQLLLAGLFLAGATPALAVTLSLGGTTVTLDDRGAVTSILSADGQEHAPAGAPPAFEVETDQGRLQSTSVVRQGNALTVLFGSQGRMRLAVTEGQGFALLKVTELAVPGTVARLQLFCLPVKTPGTVAHTINACYDDRFAMAVMATEINVRPRLLSPRGAGQDQKGCTHRFEPVTDAVREGKSAARFTATSSRTDAAGWSMVSRGFPTPLDLRGCKAIRAWVHGDGGGQSLKIQLNDGGDGYRDDYVKVDFTGWRQVVFDRPDLNTLRYDRVARIGFYYNALPAGKTVTCTLDGVEALVGEGEQARAVPLEGFEDRTSDLWPVQGARLYADTIAKHGIRPAGVGILACPRAQLAQTMERFERAAGLPSPHPGGVWGKLSPRVKKSYLFITRFAESDTEDVIAFARRGRFDTILIEQSSWASSTGHYPINTRTFPRGLDGLRDTVKRMQRAGFRVGLHYLAPSIYPPDAYLTPVPDPRLVRDAFADLAGDVDEKADFIPTAGPPEAFPAEDGGYEGHGAVLQIGSELLQYRERSMAPPYGFRGCTRGLHGTRPAAHAKGERVAHLLKSYGYFLFDMDTNLIDEVADNFARVANTCGIDMVYWDGSERLQGDHWYYNAKLQRAFYDRFKNKDMLCQGSSFSHYSWHILSRQASADGHDDLKGYLDERAPSFTSYFAPNLMPLDVGWYYVYDTKTTTDQFEYILGKSLGYGASISLQTSPTHIRNHPYIGEIVDLVAAYERLRLDGRTPAETLERLRVPQKDYHLVEAAGKQALQRVVYEPLHEVTSLDGKSNVWEVEVKDGPCRVGVQLHVPAEHWVRPGASYRSPKALLMEGFDDLAPYLNDPKNRFDAFVIGPGKAGSVHQGVTQEFRSTEEGAVEGKRCAVYTATSTLSGAGGWSSIGRRFDPALDLSWHKAIGFWLRGDGNGGLFKLQLRDVKGAAADYYVSNDYTGWRYQQLPRPEKDAIDYGQVGHLIWYYNALPAKKTVTCAIDDVKALPALDSPALATPTLEVAGRRLSWPATLAAGQAITYRPQEGAFLSGAGMGKGKRLDAPAALTLPPGRHTVRFTCQEPMTAGAMVRILLEPPEQLELGK